MTEPILVPIRRVRLGVIGASCGVVALISLGFCALMLMMSPVQGWLAFTSLACAVIFGGIGALLGGIALRAPVALRMDRHGISGFYAEPATWDEIKDIGVGTAQVETHRSSRSHRFLGFVLHDPVAFRDRQSAWRRLTSWSSGRSTGFHIILSETVIAGADIDTLAHHAQQLKDAA